MAVQGVNSTSMTKENNVTDIMDDKGCGERKETGNLSLTLHSDSFSGISDHLTNCTGSQEELVIQPKLDGTYSDAIDKTSNMGNRMPAGACVLPASKISPTDSSDYMEENVRLESTNATKTFLTDGRKNRKKKPSKDQCLGMPTKIFATGSIFAGNSRGDQEIRPPLQTEEYKQGDQIDEVQSTRLLPAVGDCNIAETFGKGEENKFEIGEKSSVLSIERKLSYLSVPPFEVPGPDISNSIGEKTKLNSDEGTECILAVDEKPCPPSIPKDPKNSKMNCHGWWKFDLGYRKQKVQTKNRKFAFSKKE